MTYHSVDAAANIPEVKRNFTNCCRCDECEEMPTVVENVCCMNNSVIGSNLPTLDSTSTFSCITKVEAFPVVCLCKDILEIQLCTIRDLIAEKMQHAISNRKPILWYKIKNVLYMLCHFYIVFFAVSTADH